MLIGQSLDGRYQVIQVLGSGGFSRTYIAKDTRRPGNPTCVVKQLKAQCGTDPNFLLTARRLFASEAETLEQLGNHPQIPRLLAYFEEDQEFYLVQEFIAGHPLSEELPLGQRWAEASVITLLQEILDILQFIHSQGVIHRDIKPENLIRRQLDNKLVLVDFGAVKQVGNQMFSASEQVSVAIGTPGYMSSEQGRGQPRPNSDIYALGIIGIQALTGMTPLQLPEDPKTGEILWQQIADVSPRLAGVLNRMVRYHFKDRYETATEALQALQPLVIGGSSSLNGRKYPPPAPFQPASLSSISAQHTLPVVPQHSWRNPVSLPQNQGSIAAATNKFPWLLGIGMAVVVTAAVGVSVAIYQKSQSFFGEISNNQGSKDNCKVIVPALNVRSQPNGEIINAVQQGTSLALTGIEKNGWVQITSPLKGWVFKQQMIDCSSSIQKPVEILIPTPRSSPENPKPLLVDRGGDILQEATKQYVLGKFDEAIAQITKIDSTSSAYQDAQKMMQAWQQDWSTAQTKFNQAQKALNERRWEDVLALKDDPAFPNHQYWRSELHKLVVIAERRTRSVTSTPTRNSIPRKQLVPSCEPEANDRSSDDGVVGKYRGSCTSPPAEVKSTPTPTIEPSVKPNAENFSIPHERSTF